MPRCAGIKRDGDRCTVEVAPGATHCYSHDPTRAAERQRNAARGGKAKAGGEIRTVKTRLQTLADMVEEGQIDRADAAVIGQLWGTYIRAVGMELKVREQMELEERLEELERVLEAKRERGWGYRTS